MIKGMFSLIMPAHKLFKNKDGKYAIQTAIDSLLDQDYKKYEIIVVANGEDRFKIMEFIQKQYKDKVKTLTIPQPNVCMARNAGARLAQGEFYSFFSSDFIMRPGGLRMWKQALDKYPEAIMVYSGYGLLEKGEITGQIFPSEEFNRYKLECYNYIDGGFPIRSKDYKEWTTEQKSLNDWDWVLKLTNEGQKCQYIKDIVYDAEIPKQDGLSNDSNDHWMERVTEIKVRNKIPIRDTCVVSLGAPFHALRTAKILNADYSNMPSFKPHEYKIIYLLGFYVNRFQDHAAVFMNTDPDCLRVIHWIGTDIAQLYGTHVERARNMVEGLNEYMDIQLVEHPATQEMLTWLHLKTNVVPLPLDVRSYTFQENPPEKYKVAIYHPKGDQTTQYKYNIQLMIDIAKSCPDINFLFFGGGEVLTTSEYKNIEYCGWCDIRDVIKETSILLRFCTFDGYPISPIEFILSGREVITSFPMVGSHVTGHGRLSTDTYEDRKKMIIETIREIKKNPLSIEQRRKHADFYLLDSSIETFKERFNKLVVKRRKEITKIKKELKKKNDTQNTNSQV